MTNSTDSNLRIADAKAVRNELLKVINELETKVWRKVNEVRNDADRDTIRKAFIEERDAFATKTLSAISTIIRNA